MNTSKKGNAQTIVKGLLITSVIYFHASMFVALPNPASVLSDYNLLLTLFPFLMMVFFFYAGYNYSSGKRTPWENIKRRGLQLLIPFVITAVVSTLLIIAIRKPTGESWEAIGNGIIYSLLSEPWSQMIGFPSSGVLNFDLVVGLGILWFLYALYIVSIFFFLIVDYAIKKPTRLLSIMFALLVMGFCLGQFVGVYLPYTCQCYPVVLAMMLLAAYLKQYNFLDKPIENKKDLTFTIINTVTAEAIVAGIGLFGYYTYDVTMIGALPGGKFDEAVKGYDAFIALGIGFLGTYAIHQVSRLFTITPVLGDVLDWYGRHSSYTYLCHPIILSFIHAVIFDQKVTMGDFQPYLYSFIAIGVLVIIYLIADYIASLFKNKKAPKEAI